MMVHLVQRDKSIRSFSYLSILHRKTNYENTRENSTKATKSYPTWTSAKYKIALSNTKENDTYYTNLGRKQSYYTIKILYTDIKASSKHKNDSNDNSASQEYEKWWQRSSTNVIYVIKPRQHNTSHIENYKPFH